jgi:hypothetical protein
LFPTGLTIKAGFVADERRLVSEMTSPGKLVLISPYRGGVRNDQHKRELVLSRIIAHH